MPYKKMSRRPRRKIARRRVAAKRTRVSKTIKRYVKKQIHASIENKFLITVAANQTVSTANATAPYSVNLMPAIGQGTGRTQRIANKCSLRKAVIRGQISLKGYNATTNPTCSGQLVKMWLVSVIQQNPSALPASATTSFFDYSVGGTGFGGNSLDMQLPVSQEDYRVLATKTFKLGITSSTSFTSGAVWNDNSQFSAPFYFSYGKHFKSKLLYPDTATVSYPTNKNAFLVVQVVPADNSSAASTIQPLSITYAIHQEFEDA